MPIAQRTRSPQVPRPEQSAHSGTQFSSRGCEQSREGILPAHRANVQFRTVAPAFATRIERIYSQFVTIRGDRIVTTGEKGKQQHGRRADQFFKRPEWQTTGSRLRSRGLTSRTSKLGLSLEPPLAGFSPLRGRA